MGGISSTLLPNDLLFSRDRSDHLIGSVVRIDGRPYKFIRRLGSGGFGSVYAAHGPEGDVAVKVIDISGVPDIGEALVSSYLTEVRLLNRLRKESRHVVHIYGFDFDPKTGRAYIVMELGGESLAAFIERMHRLHGNPRQPGAYLDPIVRHYIWRQVVSIIKTLTSNNIVHMDLKPANLILFGNTLKIIDLGIAKKSDVLGQAGVGTLYYSAPEVMNSNSFRGEYYGPKADVWSLGAILYYMTYGTEPDYIPLAANPPEGQYPSRDRDLVDVLRRALVLEPNMRADIYSLSRHPYTIRPQ